MPQIRPISNALQEKAKKELNEVPARIPQDILHIKDWLAKQQHIRARIDDQWILNFLRGTKFSLERTKEKLDLFYTMKTLMPAFYTNRNPFLPDIQKMLNSGHLLPLPKTVGGDGPRILLLRYGHFDTKIPFDMLIKTLTMINDILFYEDDDFVIGGQHLIVDFADSSLEYLLSLNVNDVKKWEICLEKAYPSRPQAFDVINSSSWYETLLSLIRSMLSNKVKDRLHIYGKLSQEEIFKIIPRTHLPKEYGGDCGTIAELTAYWKKKVENYKDWFLEEEQYGVNESTRPGKPKIHAEIFGVSGSFRKLEID